MRIVLILVFAATSAGAFGQSQGLFSYLNLTNSQFQQILGTGGQYFQDINGRAAQIQALNDTIAAESKKTAPDQGVLGMANVAIEKLCRLNYTGANDAYLKNEALLDPSQQALLKQILLAGQQAPILAQAKASHLVPYNLPTDSAPPFYSSGSFGLGDDLIAFLQLTSEQLTQIRALETAFAHDNSQIYDAGFWENDTIALELGYEVPDPSTVGGLFADVEYRRRQIGNLLDATLGKHRTVLTVGQQAKLDTLSENSRFRDSSKAAANYLLAPTPIVFPASSTDPTQPRHCIYTDFMFSQVN